MLDPDDIGHRVVVRRVVGHQGDRPLMSDALGELRTLTDTELTVATAAGEVTVPTAAVVAAKRVPPQRVTRRAIAALEQAANEAWPAPEQESLGGWLLRAADGYSLRANSALAAGDPGVPLADAVAAAARWYSERGLPPRITVPLPLAAPVETLLSAHHWRPGTPVLVQTAELTRVRSHAPHPPGPPRTAAPAAGQSDVTLAMEPTPRWLALADSRGGETANAALPAAARHVLTAGGHVPVRFAHLSDGAGELLAAGRGTVTGSGRWLGLSRVAVIPAARRGGLAQRIVDALVAWGGEAGATDAFLQVEDNNTAALALYARLGFTNHHRYVTYTAPDT